MEIFSLPDLGEGLPDAEIYEWFVQEGDSVTAFQPMVSMETAKAVVDVPCPQDGIIKILYGKPGDIIKTGTPLVAFATPHQDSGTVVGILEESNIVQDDHFIVRTHSTRPHATSSVRFLAKKLGVSLDKITPTGDHHLITRDDIENAARRQNTLPEGFEPLQSVRRAMCQSMMASHQHIVPVTLFDEADIHTWGAHTDITVRLMRALQEACQCEPALNAWFDTHHMARRCFQELHIGLAMDHDNQLFVPVISHVAQHTDAQLRDTINHYKQAVSQRTIQAHQLQGATITLSNFGKFAGRFASPLIMPPTVAILAVGQRRQGVIVTDEGKIEAHPLLPLSLSFDHRAITGGEATRFLGAVINALQRP